MDARVLRIEPARVGEVAERAAAVAGLPRHAGQFHQDRHRRRLGGRARLERFARGAETARRFVRDAETLKAFGGSEPSRAQALQQPQGEVVALVSGQDGQDRQDVRLGELRAGEKRVRRAVGLRAMPETRLVGAPDGENLRPLLLGVRQPRQALERGCKLAPRLQQHGALVERFRLGGLVAQQRLIRIERLAEGAGIRGRNLLIEMAEVQVGVGQPGRAADGLTESILGGLVVPFLRLHHAEEILDLGVCGMRP